ncbi:MAG: ribulose-phosphate 3-epimerase [Chloroflexi bacterium]|nr:ribulose-phosphate 3-epimerase [Chloroflexota bacterium]
MAHSVKIAPSVLSADFTRLGEQVQIAAEHGASQIHIDVMDGVFVPNITMGPLVVKAIRRVTRLPLDVHLMIIEPDRHVQAFADAGASALTVHFEACPHLHRTLQYIKSLGVRAGVAINPHTPATLLSEIAHLVDIVLVMTVNPGFGGQAFLPETLPKIRQIRQMLGERPVDIGVDGGIDAQTTPQVLEAGANVLIAGNAIFAAAGGIASGMKAIKQAAGK